MEGSRKRVREACLCLGLYSISSHSLAAVLPTRPSKRYKVEDGPATYSIEKFRDRWWPDFHPVRYLPREILFEIFSHCSFGRIVDLSRVCKHWYICSRENLLWRKMTFEGFHVRNLPQVMKCLDNLFRRRRILLHELYGHPAPDEDNPVYIPVHHLSFAKSHDVALLNEENFVRFVRMIPELQTLVLPSVSRATSSITDGVLQCLPRLSRLRKLDISSHRDVTDVGLKALTGCSMLCSLNLDYCKNITSEGLLEVFRRCRHIRSLSALFCTECALTGSDLCEMAQGGRMRNVVHLGIEVGDIMDFEEGFFTEARNVRVLQIRGWYVKYGHRVTTLFRLLRKLERATVHFHPRSALEGALIRSEALEEVAFHRAEAIRRMEFQNCPKLRTVRFEQNRVLDGIRFIDTPNVTELKLRGSRLDGIPIREFIDQFPILKSLEIFDCGGFEDLQTKSGSLESLNVFMCGDLKSIEVANTDRLRSLTVDVCLNLHRVMVFSPNLESAKIFSLPHDQVPLLQELQIYSDRLRVLNLQRCVNLQRVRVKCEALRALNLSQCKRLDLKMLELQTPRLTKFALSLPDTQQRFSPDLVRFLSTKCPDLTMLSLNTIPTATDESVQAICQYWPGLQALVLTNCSAVVNPKIQSSSLIGILMNGCTNLRLPEFRCENLKKLRIQLSDALVDAALNFLSKGAPFLAALEIQGCASIRNPKLQNEHLRVVSFNQCPSLNRPVFETPQMKQNLFKDCYSLVTPSYVYSENIQKLVFQHCENASDVLFSRLGDAPRLRQLFFEHCNKLFQPTIRLRSLEEILFDHCKELLRPEVWSNQLQQCSFRDCPCLRFGKVDDILRYVQNEMRIFEVNGCPNLLSLVIDNVRASTVSVVGCRHLNQAMVRMPDHPGTNVTIAGCPSMQLLRVAASGTSLSLSACPKMSVVDLKGVSSVSFHALPTLTDQSLPHVLASAPQVQSLSVGTCENLMNPRFAHPGVQRLRIYDCRRMRQATLDLPRLERLHLQGNQFHGDFVRNLPKYMSHPTSANVQEVVLNGYRIK